MRGIVEVRFGDEDEATSECCREVVDFGGELLEEVDRGAIDDLVNGIEAEAVDVEVPHPHQGVVEEEAANFVRASSSKLMASPQGVLCLSVM